MRWLDGINGHELEQTLGLSEGQGSLACCCSWCCKELDMTQGLKNKNNVSFKLEYKYYILQRR